MPKHLNCCLTHRAQHDVSLELDVVHDVMLEVATNVDLGVGIVPDVGVHNGKEAGKVERILVAESCSAAIENLKLGHVHKELEGLRCQGCSSRGKQARVSADASISGGLNTALLLLDTSL